MRLFVAADIDEAVRQEIRRIIAAIASSLQRATATGVRWINPDNMHVTLRFIGEVPGERFASIRDALAPAMTIAAFDVRFGELGTFPPSGPPRVVWLGVSRGRDELARLHDEIEARLVRAGVPPEERAFTAHLTLARVRERSRRGAHELRRALGDRTAGGGECRIDAATLYESTLSSKGSIYTARLRMPLAP
jgi:2'-5' RNA ligase